MSDFPTVPPTPPPGGPDPVPGPAPFGQASPPPWGSTPTGPGPVPPPGPSPWGGAPVPPGTPPPGWGQAPGWQPGGATPPRKHGLATASLILGIIGLVLCFVFVPSLLAVIFGAVALSAIKKSDGQVLGRSSALWGLILGIVGLLLFAGIVAIGVFTEDDTSSGEFDTSDLSDIFDDSEVLDDGDTNVFAVEIGDCITVPEGNVVVRSVETVDCDQEHDGEVFAKGALDGDRPFPGDVAVTNEVDAICTEAFEDFVGVAYDESVYGIYYFTPLENGWRLGNHRYTCIATAPVGQTLDGSIEGSGR